MAKRIVEIDVPEGWEVMQIQTGLVVIPRIKIVNDVNDRSVPLRVSTMSSGFGNSLRILEDVHTGLTMVWIGDKLDSPELIGKSIVLSDMYNWEFIIHKEHPVLIPTRK